MKAHKEVVKSLWSHKTGRASGRYWPVIEGSLDCGEPTMEDWGSQPMRARTEEWKCLWPLLAGHRRSCRLRRANRRQLEMLTNEDADGVVDGMTLYFVHLLSTPTRGQKTGRCSAYGRYWPVIAGADDCGEATMDDWGSQPMTPPTEGWKCLLPLLAGQRWNEAKQRQHRWKTRRAYGRYGPGHRRRCGLRGGNRQRLGQPANDGADRRLIAAVPLAVTGRS
nr:unnamed protein product [Spirometra erinaceieuropaei]